MHDKHVCYPLDLGPAFIGMTDDQEGTVTCLITPRARDDEAVKIQAVELLHRAGVNCGTCTTCPIGLSTREA
jgi:hypothetical protein